MSKRFLKCSYGLGGHGLDEGLGCLGRQHHRYSQMPNNLSELKGLLQRASRDSRNELGQIIEAPFGNDAGLLCDHLTFLRSGAIGQIFDGRDYKQLVTDVADRVGIDWNACVAGRSWNKLNAREIEDAIAFHVDFTVIEADDTELHVSEGVAFALKSLLLRWIVGTVPLASVFAPEAEKVLNDGLSLLSTDWRKLLAAVLFVKFIIRPEVDRP